MLPKRFDQTKPFLTLGLLVAAWLLAPAAIKTFTRASFFNLQAPANVAASYLRDLQDYWALRLHSDNDLIQAGRDLARVNATYEFQLQQNARLEAEVTRLEQMLRLPSFPAFRYEPARVARRDLSGWWQQLVIRKGANFGLTVGDPVVFSGGVVGRVREVHAYTSVVDLITSPSLRIAASVQGDSRPISYQGGDNPPFRRPHGTVEFVPLDIFANAQTPKILVTSGLGGVFPPGLIIGDIVKLEPSADGLFKSGEVALDPRLDELTEVTVLVPLSPQN